MRTLAKVLEEIVEHNKNYARRYELVFQAIPLALAAGIAAGVRLDPAEPDWPVVYIDLPTGQVSWHMPAYAKLYDGHTDERKFKRIREYVASVNDAEAAFTIAVANGETFIWIGGLPDGLAPDGTGFLRCEGGALVNTAHIVSMIPVG